jgi:hypothetical protein
MPSTRLTRHSSANIGSVGKSIVFISCRERRVARWSYDTATLVRRSKNSCSCRVRSGEGGRGYHDEGGGGEGDDQISVSELLRTVERAEIQKLIPHTFIIILPDDNPRKAVFVTRFIRFQRGALEAARAAAVVTAAVPLIFILRGLPDAFSIVARRIDIDFEIVMR